MPTAKPTGAGLRIQPRVTCPHCWHSFAHHDILWVSQHPDLLGDTRLGKEAQMRFLPSRFTVEGDALDTRDFPCQALACPQCHLGIPRALLEMEPLFFSVLGAPASGKSYFLASMTWQLRKTLPEYFQLSFGDAEPGANLTLSGYEELMFLNPDRDKLVALPKTDLQGDHLYDSVAYGEQITIYPRPYVFGLRPLDGHSNVAKMERLSRGLCLYDNAGEHFMPGADKLGSPVTRHLPLSRVLFFLFDPSQDPDFRRACQPFTTDPQMVDRARTYRQELVLLEAADRVRRHSGLGQGARHPRPLIVIVTKYDAWHSLLGPARHELDTRSVLIKGKNGTWAIDLDAIESLSQEVRAMLLKYRREFVAAAEGFCQEVIYIPISALGRSPEIDPGSGQLCIRPADIRSMWAEVPLIYALARWMQGLIPYARRPVNGEMFRTHGIPTARRQNAEWADS